MTKLLNLDFLPEGLTSDEALCTKHLKSTEIIIEITRERLSLLNWHIAAWRDLNESDSLCFLYMADDA